MTKLEMGLKANCIERGIANADWRLEVLSAKAIGTSDFAEVAFKTFPPKARKGFLHTVNINIARNLVHWDTWTASCDRV